MSATETWLLSLARHALAEDVGRGDVTTRLVVEPAHRARGVILAAKPTVVAGTDVAREVFLAVDDGLRVTAAIDGKSLDPGGVVMTIEGSCGAILTGERTALNFLQRLCGIATLAAEATRRVQGTGARILDTRKTTPGLRRLEKAAARAGGVVSHRGGLDDGILIKDNHIACCGSAAEAVRRARQGGRALLRIEVEIDDLDDLEPVIDAGADVVLLDNMDAALVAEAVRRAGGRVELEASGGIDLDTVRAYAETGVDAISLGCVTHSAMAADLSLDLTLLERARES